MSYLASISVSNPKAQSGRDFNEAETVYNYTAKQPTVPVGHNSSMVVVLSVRMLAAKLSAC